MSSDEHWFLTPENCPNPEKLERINKRIYEEIVKLEKQEKIDPITHPEDRKNFLAQFPGANSVLDSSPKKTSRRPSTPLPPYFCTTSPIYRWVRTMNLE